MKLCIPVVSNEGFDSEICGHFGSAPWFMLYDQAHETVEAIVNIKAEHEHGQCRPMDLLADRGIGAVICKGMGRNAIDAIERKGMKVFMTSGLTVRHAIDEFMDGRLVKFDAGQSCRGPACH